MALENGFTTRESFIDMTIIDTPTVVSSYYRNRKRNILLGFFGIVLVGVLITIFFVYKVIFVHKFSVYSSLTFFTHQIIV